MQRLCAPAENRGVDLTPLFRRGLRSGFDDDLGVVIGKIQGSSLAAAGETDAGDQIQGSEESATAHGTTRRSRSASQPRITRYKTQIPMIKNPSAAVAKPTRINISGAESTSTMRLVKNAHQNVRICQLK